MSETSDAKIWPPSIPEWHSSVVGFAAGFAFGAADRDERVIVAAVRAVTTSDIESGHIAQARREAAYAAACFVVGSIVGKVWSGRRNA